MKRLEGQNSPQAVCLKEMNPKKISEHEAALLLELVNGTRSFVCSTVSGAGRSLYLPPFAEIPFALKIKGGGGLRTKAKGLEFYSPCHETAFGGTVNHVSLTPSLEFRAVSSKPKALNSLRAQGAQMEFTAQSRLHEKDLGFDGICWGEFETKDLYENPTGFCISEHDPSYVPLENILKYQEPDRPGYKKLLRHDLLPEADRDFHLHMVERLGAVKRKMAQQAEIGRHSSTLGNFLYSPEKDHLQVTDTDTTVDYRALATDAHGSQFLRDSVSDTMKRVEELRFSSGSATSAEIAENVLHKFLVGLFADSVKPVEIRRAIMSLGIKERVGAITTPDLSGWTYFGGMAADLYQALYALFLKSDLTDLFLIKKIDPEVLGNRAKKFYLENNIL